MEQTKSIAFYCDVHIFSGHEMMSAHIANVASRHCPVTFFHIHPKYREHLNDSIRTIQLPADTASDGLIYLFFKSWRDTAHIAKLLRDEHPDVLIVCQGEYHMCLKGLIAARRAGIPCVLSYIPICYPYSIYKMSFPRLRFLIYRFIEKRFHGLITITAEQMALFRKYISASMPVYLVENHSAFKGKASARKNKKPIRLGIIGRIQNSKGQYRTVEIAENVLNHRDDFQFIFFGEGEKENYLKKTIHAKKLEQYFDFRGWVNNREQIFSEINALLILSDLEGLPLVFLESLYFKVPVFTSRLANNPVYEHYIDMDFIFESSIELADKIINFERYAELFEKKADSYRKLVIERHGEKTFSQNVLNLLTEIAGVVPE